MKTLILILALAFSVKAASFGTAGNSVPIPMVSFISGGTNYVAINSTNTYSLTGTFGTSRTVAFSLSAQFLGGGSTNSGTVVATFDRSVDGTHWELGAQTLTVTITGTSQFTSISNVDTGGVSGWRLASVGQTNQWLDITNLFVLAGPKPGI